ncbi:MULTISPECIES: rhodanese-like domain-containing protein [Streptomycetaceae]|uniref:Rhodanese-like domain-containing protein n=2 Tax=Streptomycetaceae TaxID=2062 RepID=A0ABT5Z3P6_9ACTN|nr:MULTISPECIES: rhodanese-like domain-containing protein [Streptomycetaceae]MDF2258445.1 rhodanese-like domain-containing protein [Streptantibioticus ferralitis]MDF3291283.1 rhodanese-like domain-containing protein [Streptomyces silvisoli]
MTREIDLDTFAGSWAEGGFVLLDVHEPDEYRAGHVPGALLVPLAKLPAWGDAPTDRPAYAICASGIPSLGAADWMCARGIDERSVNGGARGWAQAGHPLATVPHPR